MLPPKLRCSRRRTACRVRIRAGEADTFASPGDKSRRRARPRWETGAVLARPTPQDPHSTKDRTPCGISAMTAARPEDRSGRSDRRNLSTARSEVDQAFRLQYREFFVPGCRQAVFTGYRLAVIRPAPSAAALKSANSMISPLSVPVLTSSVERGEEVVDDKVRHRFAEFFTRIFVRAEMLTREDAAQACLVLRVRKAVESASHPGKHFRSNDQIKSLVTEDGVQHELAACADRGMCAGVRRISRSLGGLRKPIRVRRGVGVAVSGGGANRGHRPPKVI